MSNFVYDQELSENGLSRTFAVVAGRSARRKLLASADPEYVIATFQRQSTVLKGTLDCRNSVRFRPWPPTELQTSSQAKVTFSGQFVNPFPGVALA